MYFDRFDICEAHWLYYGGYHANGLTRRCHRQGRGIAAQLSRMRFKPSPLLHGPESLTDNGRIIYDALVTSV